MNHRYLCFAQRSCPRPPWCQDRTAPDQRSFNNVDPACELDARVVGCCSAKATASSPETRRFGPVRPLRRSGRPPPPRGGGGRPDRRRGPPPPPPPLRLHLARARDRVGLRRSLVGEPPPLAPGPGVEGAGAQQPPRARAASPTRGVPAGNGTGHPPSTNHRAALEHYMRSQGLNATRQNPSPRQPTPSYPVFRCWLRNHRLPFTFPPPPLLTGASPHCGWGREPPQLGHHPFPLILFFFPLSSKACSSTLGSPAVSIFPPARRRPGF